MKKNILKIAAIALIALLLAVSCDATSAASSTQSINSGKPGNPPGGRPGSESGASSVTYSGAVEITSADTQSGQTYQSSTTDESALLIRWPKYWAFSCSSRPSNEYSGLISFRIDFQS